MNMLRASLVLTALLVAALPVSAQDTETSPRVNSIAVEADVLAYGLPGYSGIINVSLANGFQIAFGQGRYEVPSFLLKGDANYDAVQWKATSTSIQVLRTTYRFKGPMKSGPALGAIVLNQRWRLRSERVSGDTTFRPLSVGVTGGYYVHVGQHFYIYPTAAFTYNRVVSGSTKLGTANYHVERLAPNASLHMGWAWGI